MLNNAASAPPTIAYRNVVPASASVALTVVTADAFSSTAIRALSPPPFEMITGALLGSRTNLVEALLVDFR
jgi:hypothetical protein